MTKIPLMKTRILRKWTRRPVFNILEDRYTPHRNFDFQERTGLQHSWRPVHARKSISLDWEDRSSTFLKTGTQNNFPLSDYWRPVFNYLEDRYTQQIPLHWSLKTGLQLSWRPVHAKQWPFHFKGTGLQLSWRPVHTWANLKFSKNFLGWPRRDHEHFFQHHELSKTNRRPSMPSKTRKNQPKIHYSTKNGDLTDLFNYGNFETLHWC